MSLEISLLRTRAHAPTAWMAARLERPPRLVRPVLRAVVMLHVSRAPLVTTLPLELGLALPALRVRRISPGQCPPRPVQRELTPRLAPRHVLLALLELMLAEEPVAV